MSRAMRIAGAMLAVLTRAAMPQTKPGHDVDVVTVCEVLGNPAKYAQRPVAIVGRLESSVSLVDHYNYLSQDQCEHPVVTYEHVWSNRIQIETVWERGMPTPPQDRPRLDRGLIAAKSAEVHKTTVLGSHEEPLFRREGRSIIVAGRGEVPNSWALVYGRIAPVATLSKDCGASGCGGDDVPYGIIAKPYNVHELSEDGRLLPGAR